MVFIENCLFESNSSILYHAEPLIEDQEIFPTCLVHFGLWKLVNATALNLDLISLKPEISQALNSLLKEILTVDDAKALQTATPSIHLHFNSSMFYSVFRVANKNKVSHFHKSHGGQVGCCHFKHFLSECSFFIWTRQVVHLKSLSDHQYLWKWPLIIHNTKTNNPDILFHT